MRRQGCFLLQRAAGAEFRPLHGSVAGNDEPAVAFRAARFVGAGDFREEALRCGAQDYLLQPMAPDEFLRRANQAIAYFVPPEQAKAAG